MRRFVVEPELIDRAMGAEWTALPPELYRHAVRAVRLSEGDEVELRDADRRSVVARLEKRDSHWGLSLVTEPVVLEVPSERSVWLLPGVFKAKRLRWLVEKATELGADAIAPFIARRSVGRADGESATRGFERIMKNAARQSGAVSTPTWHVPTSLPSRLDALASNQTVLIATRGAEHSLLEVLPQGGGAVALVTGPEGGLTDEERALLDDRGAVACGLGPRTLRAETAPIAALSAIRLADAASLPSTHDQ